MKEKRDISIPTSMDDDLFVVRNFIQRLLKYQDQEFEALWDKHKDDLTGFTSKEIAKDFLFDYVFNNADEDLDFGSYLMRHNYNII